MMKSCRNFGLWNTTYDSSWWRRITYIIYTVIMISFMPIFAATIVGDLCDNTNDLLIVTDNALFLAGIALVLVKLFYFHKYREQIGKLIDDVYVPIDCLMKSSEKSVLMLVKYCTFWEQLQEYSFAASGAFLLIALMFLVPTEKGSLPIRAKYPFDYSEQPMHSVVFVLQTLGVMNGLVTIFSLDALVLSICRWTSLQLEILNLNFQHCELHWTCSHFGTIFKDVEINLIDGNEDEINCFIPFSSDEVEKSEEFVERLKICVRHHVRVIDLVGRINEFFGAGMFAQLFASSFIICLTGFQALLGTTGTNALKYGFFGVVAFFDLGIWCLYGNDLLFQSIALVDNVWFSGWENELSTDVACLLVVSLARAGQALELKAGNFYQMSMDTFIMILKTTYSAFALLAAVTDQIDG